MQRMLAEEIPLVNERSLWAGHEEDVNLHAAEARKS
jgi:hypothetical protein